MNEKNGFSLGRAIIIGGSFIAFAIGSGFSTGQEVLQFYTAFGFESFWGVVIFTAILIYMCYNFLLAGKTAGLDRGSQVFQHFCGKYIGTFFDWFTVLFVFMSFVVMIAGAGATLNQHYGIPASLGGVLITVLAVITVMFGLSRMVDIIGVIGPVIIVVSCVASVLGISYGQTGIARGNEIVGSLGVMAAGSNWFISAISYAGFGLLWFAAYFAAIGKTEKHLINASVGMFLGVVTLSITIVVITLCLLANIELVATSQIPLLLMLDNINHNFATVFSIIIFLGIYSTACPLLWTVSNRMAEEKTAKYKIVTLVLAAAALLIGILLPFNRLVNIIYVLNGYVGFILIAFVAFHNIRGIVKK